MKVTFDIPEGKLVAVTTAVQAVLNADSPVENNDWRNETGFPKIKVVDGKRYMLKAPINPDWLGSTYDYTFGGEHLGDNGPYLQDPSNADDTHALRSPNGYPLFWPKDGDKCLDLPNMPPRILFEAQTFENDAMVADFKIRAKAQLEERYRAQREMEARNAVLQPGMLDMSTYNAEDLMFAGTFMSEIGPGKQGPRNIEKAFNNWWHDGSSALPELPVTAEILERKHQPWDWSTYHGPVRKLIPRLDN